MAVEDKQPMQADETLSPVDLPAAPAAEDGHALRWTSVVIAVAAAFLLLFNAATIDEWAHELPPGPAAARLTTWTGAWAGLGGRIGLSTPRAAVHALWKRGQALRFDGEARGEGPAPDTSPPSH
ncbi:MAG: hypothetical protein JWL91_156 [Sphingomonas bacterium]|nr:hypothetical protein [Sphingomonas bacterium]MDB5688280.1 hypothetical protein [Sphingomonas bacterium]